MCCLLGKAVNEMTENFEEFWNSEFAHPVETILEDEHHAIMTPEVDQEYTRRIACLRQEPKELRTADSRGHCDDRQCFFPVLLQAHVMGRRQVHQ